nr:hypothetical protein CFP56_59610 [Quercus suber]
MSEDVSNAPRSIRSSIWTLRATENGELVELEDLNDQDQVQSRSEDKWKSCGRGYEVELVMSVVDTSKWCLNYSAGPPRNGTSRTLPLIAVGFRSATSCDKHHATNVM